MTEPVDKILKLKSKIDRMKSDRDKAKGAYEQVMNSIQTEFDCGDLEAAEKLSTKMQKENKVLKECIAKETEKLESELEEHESWNTSKIR